MRNKSIAKYILLYIPWLLAILFNAYPVLSYLIAWLGSFFIFYVTLSGKVQELPTDRRIADQLMRPLFLVQIVFAGFMCCTSFFYFLDVMGYEDFHKSQSLVLLNQTRLDYTAQCQRYYCLAHAAFVTGVLTFMNYPVKQRYYIRPSKIASLLLTFALITLPVSILF